MSFQFNSDKEILRAVNPSVIADQSYTIRAGTGSTEKEIFRAQLDSVTNLPRVGINRTGKRVERIDVPDGQGGSGYTLVPSVELSAPTLDGGRQALASAAIFNGEVSAIIVDDPGDGYELAPTVEVTGGNGVGAVGISFLDTVDFELDINGAIRTSTSIISDTARILNLDIDNFITPDANFRAPNLKTYINNTGVLWAPSVIVLKNTFRYFGGNIYQVLETGTTGTAAPTHNDGIELNGTASLKHVGFRIVDDTQPFFEETGEAGVYPRSITPLLGDKSDKIATTEYVLNLATNDVGGRVYVSQQIGSDDNDGRSAVAPVRTIKKACQEAWKTPGVKETIIVAGGDYLEDNPISIPPDASVVGDNLRLVLIRPANPRKHIFKFGDKNYVTGVTYRDQIDSNGDSVATWDFAMVFDDKQRIDIDTSSNGDFGLSFPVGHQIFGPNRERVTFQTNTGLNQLVAGLSLRGVNTGSTALINEVTFNQVTGVQAYISGTANIEILSGSFISGETFEYFIVTPYTPTDVTYDPQTGISQFTVPNHGFADGDKIRINIESLGYTCDMDGNTNIKYYPRSSDPAANQFLTISAATTNTFELDVGDSQNINHQVSYATYDTASGVAVLTIGTHTLGVGTSIKLRTESLGFSCSKDGYSSVHFYPRATDPAYDTAIEILEVTSTTITINVGASGPDDQYVHAYDSSLANAVISGGNYPHTFVSARANALDYLDSEFEFVSTDIQSIRAEGEIVFSNDPGEVEYPIPRIDFSLQGTAEVATGGFEYGWDGGGPEDLGGIVFYTNELIGRQNVHDLKNGQEILIEGLPTSSPDLSFLNGRQRIYKVLEDADGRCRRFVIPKKTSVITDSDFEPGNLAKVTSASKSITMTLLNSPNKFNMATPVARRFQDASLQIRNNLDYIADEVVGRVNDEFKKEYFAAYDVDGTPSQQFTPTNVTYDPATGESIFTVNNHGLVEGDGVKIEDDSIVFTCAMDGNNTEHTAPQSHHYSSGKALPIISKTTNTFTVNVGASGPDQVYTPTGATYDPATGDLVLTIGAHQLTPGEGIVIDDNSLFFKCTMDGNDTAKSYPRPGHDLFSQRSIPIKEISETTITCNVGASGGNKYYQPSAVNYDASNGDMTVTVGQHGLQVGKHVVLEDNSFTFTCDFNGDGNTTPKSYPRPGSDPYAGKSIAITDVGYTSHTPTDAVYDAAAGTIQFTMASHGFSDGDYIMVEDGSLEYTCVLDGNTIIKAYPRTNYDYASNRYFEISNVTQNGFRIDIGASDYTGTHTLINIDPDSIRRQDGTFTINVGNAGSAAGSTHVFVSAQPGAIKFEPQSFHTFISATASSVKHLPQSAHTFVRSAANSLSIGGDEFKLFLGPSRFIHDYVSGGTVTFGGSSYNITSFTYDNIVTGSATITTDSSIPGLANDSIVQLADILLECTVDNVVTQKTYPSFNIPVSDNKCRRDIKHFLNAVIRDLEYGSNYNVIDAAKKYIQGTQIATYIDNEIIQTVRAIEYARELAIFAMRKWRTGTGLPTDPVYTSQYTSLTRYVDASILEDLTEPGVEHCANVKSAINVLSYLFVDVLTNDANGTKLDAGYLIARNRDFIADEALGKTESQYPTLGLGDVNQRKCRRDINYIITSLIRDIILGGNAAIVTNAEEYYSGTILTGIPEAQRDETIYAFEQVRDLCILAMRNWKTLGGSGSTYAPVHSPIPLFTDSSILVDQLGTPYCANIESAITTSFTLLNDILRGDIAPGGTVKNFGTLLDTVDLYSYPDVTIYDANGTVLTPRSDYDDFPIIEASPYTQNASIISFLGGGGALIDGSRVKQPNCPFPGLELDGSATFPNQGKSMVAAAFTIVSFGGIGYKVINDGYTQLVSVFVIFCFDGVLSESGGYASITNSATNFGIYALRAIGFRDEAYVFDVGTITNVSATPTGRTIFTVDGLGREPLEHYVIKIDGFENVSAEIEYFVEAVDAVTVGPPFSAQLTIDSGSGGGAEFKNISTQQAVTTTSLQGETLRLHRPSIVNSSSHTWEFAGSGTNYNSLPENGGTKVEANEQVSEQYGRVYVSGTDELGDFKVGVFARIENRTGNITFTGTVTISEVEFLKLKGGDVVVTGFDASNTLGGANSTDSKLPTQKAVKDYITNNLGPFINKPYSTNAVPRALVELTDSGKISVDQIPALRPFQVFTVADATERTSIEGALAGDIAIQQDTSTSFILNNDLDSLFVSFPVDPTISFTLGDIFTGSTSSAQIQATEYRQGSIFQIIITDPGSGYTSPPVITISGGQPAAGNIQAAAVAEIANGQVVVVEITEFNGLVGGKGYTVQPTVTFSAPSGSGTQATGNALIENRLYGDIVNRQKMSEADVIQSSDLPPVNINVTRVVNTSANDTNNWVSLSSDQIAANQIASGVIETARLAINSAAANSFTFLRGDQSYALAVQSLKGAETRYFATLFSDASIGSQQLIFTTNADTLLGHEVVANIVGIQANTSIQGVLTTGGLTTVSMSNPLMATIPAGTVIEFQRGASPITFESSYTQGSFVDNIVIADGGSGFTDGQYFSQLLSGGTGTGLKGNIIVSGGEITELTVTDGGLNYNADFNVTSLPADVGSGVGLILQAKVSTVNKQYANVSIDILRATDQTITADKYGTIGVARFRKEQFEIGEAGNGSIRLKTGADSLLDADLLDGVQGAYYLNASNLNSGTLPSDRMAGTYNISISGQSGNTLRLITGTTNPTSSPSPNLFSAGIIASTRNNTADGLLDGGSRHLVMTIRNFGSGFDATGGGARQLGFTDNDNMWIRGSGTTLDDWGSWAKVWTSINDGPGTDLDADKLDNRQGIWYQNALNMNFGSLSDNRLPDYFTAKSVKDSIDLLANAGKIRYKIYISGSILTSTPFLPGNPVNLYNNLAQAVGEIQITQIITNDESDNFNDYTIIYGVLQSGTFVGAETIGVANNRVIFNDFTVDSAGTFQVARLESDGGTANLRLGRKDGVASSPGIYFRSSTDAAANYNTAIIATGGSGTDSSGTLDVQVVNSDGFSINGNTVWNTGNITFNTTSVASTGVIRDASGGFGSGTITLDAGSEIVGSSSLNVLKSGDTMSGPLIITGILESAQALSISGRGDFLSNITVAKDISVATDTLYVDSSDRRVAIGHNNPLSLFHVISPNDGSLEGLDAWAIFEEQTNNHGRIQFGYSSGSPQIGLSDRTDDQFWALGADDSDVGYFTVSFDGTSVPTVASSASTGSNSGAVRLQLSSTGTLFLGTSGTTATDYKLHVAGNIYTSTKLLINDASNNNGAPIEFKGSTGFRNFRIGNQLVGDDIFEISPSDTAGGVDWSSTPALAILGSSNQIAINTTNFSGTDPEDSTEREYQLNVQGDVNFNGQLFQNNAEFVTSRWTESANETDIFRASKVWINADPTVSGFTGNPSYGLQVSASLGIDGATFSSGANTDVFYVNGDRQYIDTYGVFKTNRNVINENITIPANTNAMSAGPLTINNNKTITISAGSSWSVV